MKIETYYRDLGSRDVADDFRSKKIHLICLAETPGLNEFDAFAVQVGGLDFATAAQCVNRVIQSEEVGTLYPQLSMTILPVSILDSDANEAKLRAIIKDCFKAHESYIRCEELIFVIGLYPVLTENGFFEILTD